MPAPIQSVGASQTQEQVIATFPVPYKGVIRGLSEAEIPRDALWTGENFHFFEGELRQRPSWNLARNATVAAPPAGAGTILSIYSGRRATTRDQFLFVGGTKGVFVLGDVGNILGAAGWQSWKLWAATRARTNQVRFTELATGTPLLTDVIAVNGADVPVRMRIETLTANFVAAVSLVLPNDIRPKDVCTSSDRILCITDTEVYWGQGLNFTFPQLAVKSLAESLDLAIAIRPLGTLNVGIWKERSIWIGQARGGSDASYFSWRLLKWVDGPAAPNALTTDSKGNWFWMTKQGRVIMMNESYQISYPGDGVWPITRKQVSPLFSIYATCHAVYRPFHDEVWFFYQAVT